MLVNFASNNFKNVLQNLDTKQGVEVNKVKENVIINWNYDNSEWMSDQFIKEYIKIVIIIEINITISFYMKDNYGCSNLKIDIVDYKLNYDGELDDTDLDNIQYIIENEYCKKLDIKYI